MWKHLSGFNGDYIASDQGEIRNVRTKRTIGRINNAGYVVLGLKKDGVFRQYSRARLICERFRGMPTEEGMQVNHRNGIKTDDRVVNLEWVSASYNTMHAYKVLGHKNVWRQEIEMISGIGKIVRQFRNIYEVKKLGYDTEEVRKCLQEGQRTYLGCFWRKNNSLNFDR